MFIRVKKGEKGQALVESVLIVPILAMLVGGIMLFSMIFIAKCRMLMGARYGAWLIVHGNYDRPTVETEVKDFLADGKPSLRRDRISVEVNKGTLFSLSKVTVNYRVGVPRAFHSFLPNEIFLKEKCAVLAHSRIF
ncbi:hypothetical protein ES705_19646 [subsurface metagenome]